MPDGLEAVAAPVNSIFSPLLYPFRRPLIEMYVIIILWGGERCGAVVKVLCYKSEGRWFDSKVEERAHAANEQE